MQRRDLFRSLFAAPLAAALGKEGPGVFAGRLSFSSGPRWDVVARAQDILRRGFEPATPGPGAVPVYPLDFSPAHPPEPDMPNYVYACATCDVRDEVRQGFADDALTNCPRCDSAAYGRVLFPPVVIDATPKTVGSLSDRNSGGNSYWLQERRHEADEKRWRGYDQVFDSRPSDDWLGPVDTRLASLSPEQASNYIATGDTTKSGS